MNTYGCIGKTLGHSFSKDIHARLADYTYELIELSEEDVRPFFERKAFAAVNVTIPYKETVIPYLDDISAIARRIGAVNTVVNRGGKLFGHNTDYDGMKALIERLGLSLGGKKVLILGTGGTSKTARVVAADLGAAEVLCVSRREQEGMVTYEQAYALHADAHVLINTTPVGMYPACDASPVDLAAFNRLEGVVDAVYNPLRTKLVLDAKARGIKAEGGLYMLVMQAVKAVETFLNTTIAKDTADRVFESVVAAKENVVLTGMPGSGKSTVGKLLSIDGYEFVDTDAEVEKRCGCTIAELIGAKGEPYFRDLETAVIRDVCAQGGRIIATGGGAVLREENVRHLQQNGKIFFLDAALSRLRATADRPLSNTAEKLAQLYEERIERYRATADVVIPDRSTPEETAAYLSAKRISERAAVFAPCTLSGTIDAPPSKSMAHRYLIGAAVSGQRCTLTGVDYSEDILASIDCLRALGATVTTDENAVTVDPCGFLQADAPVLECRESGSTLRFLIPLALCLGKPVTLRGSTRLLERPLDVYEALCREHGFAFEKDAHAVTLCGTLQSGHYRLRGDVSSQFITGLLYALVYLNQEASVEIVPPFASRSYVDLTIAALRSFGADVAFTDEYTIVIRPAVLRAFSGKIEGDYSNAAFLEAFNTIGASVTVGNLNADSLQGDRVYADYFAQLASGTPTLDISDCPDLGPVLFALAALQNGATFTGTDRLKAKESDRAAAMHEELKKLGGGLVFGNDSVTVPKQALRFQGIALDGHNDHRIVMAMAVILSKTGGVIGGIDAVAKSYPGFFGDIQKLGAKVEIL